jgi:hypothetical protein
LPIGTPKRWVLPTTMSAPNSPGGTSRVSASRSAATMKRRLLGVMRVGIAAQVVDQAVVVGYCTSTAK